MRGRGDRPNGCRASHTDWGGARTGGYSPPDVVVNADRRVDRLTTVGPILVYAPVLMCLPVLLVGGLVFVLVPGGFIIVLGALYWVLVQFIGLAALGARRAWQASRSRKRSARAGFVPSRPTRQAAFKPVGAVAATPITAGLVSDPLAPSARSILPSRPEPLAVRRITDAQRATHPQDDTAAA
jgi:hypothetical protein